jgi:hypothetical protein
MPNGHAAACATRVYHDGRFDAGGRLYGAWTGLDKDTQRLHCTIDGEPICEIDIRGSQPTLLSCLLGDPSIPKPTRTESLINCLLPVGLSAAIVTMLILDISRIPLLVRLPTTSND